MNKFINLINKLIKIFYIKTIDDKFEEIGFKKIKEDTYGVRYQRYIDLFKYTQTLDLTKKYNNRHLVQSYDANLMDENKIGCVGVGLTMYEMQLCIKKMKKMGWKIKK